MPLSKTYKPMLFSATVTKWQGVSHGVSKRVRATTGTTYLLNTNRLDGIRTNADDDLLSLYYFDNILDHRESGHYMELTVTDGGQRGQLASLILLMDTVPTHTHMTLPIYPNMDSTETPVDTVIEIGNFAFAAAVADSGSTTDSIVYYAEDAFKLVRARVKLTLVELLALIA